MSASHHRILGGSFPTILLVCLVASLSAILGGCAGSQETTTTAGAGPSVTVPMTTTSNATSTTGADSTSKTTTETTVETTTETTVKPPGHLLHFTWNWAGDWKAWQTEDISDLAGATAFVSTRIVGDPYRYSDPEGVFRDYIFATGEAGDLLVFWNGLDREKWSVTALASPTGRPLRELLGGRAFNSPLAVTGAGTDKTIHLLAADSGDTLIHFWLRPGGSWQSEDVTSITGVSVARVGSARVAGDGKTVEVCALDPDDELLYFRLPSGGQWSGENPSKVTGRVAKREATFLADPLGSSDTTIASSCLMDDLLLYRRTADGTWTLEDITQETTTETNDPGVSLGGWLSWWDWQREDYWDGSQFEHPIAVLNTAGHFQLLERESTDSPWKVTDVSKQIGVTFAADGGGDSIVRWHNTPNTPAKEIHFAGADEMQHLIHFWRDSKGKWHSEDLTGKSGQKVAYPVNHYLSTFKSGGGAVTAYQYVAGVSPEGDLIFIWDDSSKNDWQLFNATAATGYKVRGPELPWAESSVNHLLMAGAE